MNTEQIMALIADLRSRINPAYATQLGTESYERRLCAEALEALVQERDALSKLADKWNFECDELREDNKRLAAELKQIKAQEPTGWIFTDDPSIYPLPGTGFHFGKEPPSDAVDCIPLYTRSKS